LPISNEFVPFSMRNWLQYTVKQKMILFLVIYFLNLFLNSIIFCEGLMQRDAPTAWALLIGLRFTKAANGAIQSMQWTDGTPVDFGANTAGGIPPWADSGTGYPNQPDNRPNPALCTMIWMDSTVPSGNKQPGRWDDVSCTSTRLPGVICKF
jgi:hypothetical protein